MVCAIIFLGLMLGYFVLLLRVPAGTLGHELLHLPVYWWKVRRHPVAVFGQERVRYGDHRRQYFLFFPAPAGAPPPRLVILYFHGGGWRFGAPELFRNNAAVFQAAGYPVILASHRRTPRFNYQGLREDLSSLLTVADRHLQQRGLYGIPLVPAGMSAGGNLAALLLYDRKALEKVNFDQCRFAGLMTFGAPLDLDKMQDWFLLRDFAGPRDQPMFRAANPVEYLETADPFPVFCTHGTHDGMVVFDSSRSFVERLESLHPGLTQFVVLPGGTHLDAISWTCADDPLRRKILDWLNGLPV